MTLTLGQLNGGNYSGAALLECLDDADSKVVVAAAEALGTLKDSLATRRLIRHLEKDSTPAELEVCRAAAIALGQIADRRAVPALIAALQRPKLAAVAAEALGNIGDIAAVGPLLEFLRSHRDGDLRLLDAPIAALGQLGDPRAIEPLVELFFTPDVSGNIEYALSRIHHPGVVLAVADRLAASKPSSSNVYNNSAASLVGKLTGNGGKL
jgi:HEAT repeat protein